MSNASYSETVLQTLSQLETGHLLEKVRSGNLTDEAHSLALRVLKQRGERIEDLPQKPPSDGTPESWLEPSAAELLEQARRRRMFLLPFLLPCLPVFCAVVAAGAFHGFKTGSLLDSAIAVGVTSGICIPSILTVKRYTFRWGEGPQPERDHRRVMNLWIRFAYPAYAITAAAILLALTAVFV